MTDYNTVLSAAQQLPEPDRLRLIDALWETAPASEEFSREWSQEIERRVAELNSGTASTVPWSQVLQEALVRIGHAKAG